MKSKESNWITNKILSTKVNVSTFAENIDHICFPSI